MVLKFGYGKQTIGANIATERKEGVPPKQAVAIALNTARRAAKKAGVPGRGPSPRGATRGSKRGR